MTIRIKKSFQNRPIDILFLDGSCLSEQNAATKLIQYNRVTTRKIMFQLSLREKPVNCILFLLQYYNY